MPQNEMITLHCGQAGLQMGHALWETLAAEHDITCHGLSANDYNPQHDYESHTSVFFHQVPSEQYVPRTVFIDTEPTVMDEIKLGCYRYLFHPESMIAGSEDAANNFARGYYTLGRQMVLECLNRIRYIVECCDNFGGFFSFQGSGGGTGSGTHAVIIEHIYSEFAHKSYVHSTVLPGPNKLVDAIVEPYNTTLGLAHSNDSVWNDLKFLISNDSLYNICSKQLSIERPTYTTINRLIAPIASSLTTPFRTNGYKNGHLNELFVNLVPYPQMSYPTLSYAPFQCSLRQEHDFMSTNKLIQDVFTPSHSLLNFDLEESHIISTVLAFRGNNSHIDIIKSLDKVRRDRHFNFVNWCPTGFKIIHNPIPPIHTFSEQPDKSVLMICNHSGISEVLQNISDRFMTLYHHKSFVHWYLGEGMEQDELKGSHEELVKIMTNYKFSLNDEEMIMNADNSMEKLLNEIEIDISAAIESNIKSNAESTPIKHSLKIKSASTKSLNVNHDKSNPPMDTDDTFNENPINFKLKKKDPKSNSMMLESEVSKTKSPSPYSFDDTAQQYPIRNATTDSGFSIKETTRDVMLKNLHLSEDLKNKLMGKQKPDS